MVSLVLGECTLVLQQQQQPQQEEEEGGFNLAASVFYRAENIFRDFANGHSERRFA